MDTSHHTFHTLCAWALACVIACALALYGTPVVSALADEVQDSANVQEEAVAPDEQAAQDQPASEEAATDGNTAEEPVSELAPTSEPEPVVVQQREPAIASEEKQDNAAEQARERLAEEEAESAETDADDQKDSDQDKEADAEAALRQAEREAKVNAALDTAAAALAEAESIAGSAIAELEPLPGLRAELAPYIEKLHATLDTIENLQEQREPLQETRSSYEEQRDVVQTEHDDTVMKQNKALYGMMLAEREISLNDGLDLIGVVVGDETITDIENQSYMLEKIAVCLKQSADKAEKQAETYQVQIDEFDEQISDVDVSLKVLDASVQQQTEQIDVVIKEGNAVAFQIEKICSEARQNCRDAISVVEKVEKKLLGDTKTKDSGTSDAAAQEATQAEQDAEMAAIEADAAIDDVFDAAASADEEAIDTAAQAAEAAADAAAEAAAQAQIKAAVADIKKQVEGLDIRYNPLRVEAQTTAGEWYDAVDVLGNAVGAISYGEGADFALNEDVFVEKWGNAIDSFFFTQGAPLAGQGETMARTAYAYKIDPRLCAAVSIIESSGGRYCIKPHNAWGWGAADSDPYNLASGWGSWEEAIESWHRGMATSTTGLATAPSLSQLSDIYCSTPIWASRVATFMEDISSRAVDPGVADSDAKTTGRFMVFTNGEADNDADAATDDVDVRGGAADDASAESDNDNARAADMRNSQD